MQIKKLKRHLNQILDRRVLSWISTIIGLRGRLMIAVLMLLSTMGSLVSVGSALVMKDFVDAMLAGNRPLFWRYVMLLVTVMLLGLAISVVSRVIGAHLATTTENRFKQRLFFTLLHADYGAVTAKHTGEWMNRLVSDTVEVANATISILPDLLGLFVRLIGAIVMLLYLQKAFLYVLIPAGFLVLGMTMVFRKILKEMYLKIREADGRLRVFLTERLSSMMILRAYGQEDNSVRLAAERMGDHRAAVLRRNRFAVFCHMGYSGAQTGVYLLGMIFCALQIMAGKMTYGSLTAVMQLVRQVQSPFAGFSGYMTRCFAMLASAERLMEAEDYARDCEEDVVTAEQARQYYQDEFTQLKLRGVDFTYPGENEPVVLEDFSVTVQKGKYIAFTGHSGCGKSTALRLLQCLQHPARGEMILCSRNGDQPLTAAWRALFAYVPQGNALLSGTIRDVVAFDEEVDEERMWSALRVACAEEFVREIGLDAQLHERGSGLSEGQLQRLSIARAIYSSRPILLLDEATSSLDGATEVQLLKNLRAMTDRTVIIVTHRPAVLDYVDEEVRFG